MLKLALKYSSAALEMEPTNVKASGTCLTFCKMNASDRFHVDSAVCRHTSAEDALSRPWSGSGGPRSVS